MKVLEYLQKLKSPFVVFCVSAAILIGLGYMIGRTQRSVVLSLPREQIEEPVLTAEVGKVDLNSATKAELMKLPGVGEKTADAIIEYRDDVGGVLSVDELISVKGIGEKKLEAMKPYITISSP